MLDRIGPEWRESYGSVSELQHLTQLRLVFQTALHTSHWIEYSVGRSNTGFATLDVYMDIVSDALAPDALESTWFLVNVSSPPQERRQRKQDSFLHFDDYVCQGQRHLAGMTGRRQYPGSE